MNIQRQLPIHKVGGWHSGIAVSVCGLVWANSGDVKETTEEVTCKTCLKREKGNEVNDWS